MLRRPFGLENALMGFLNQSPQHGYQLHQQIRDPAGLGLVWRIKQSQLYALLEKLEQFGYVTSSLQQQESHPPRRIYSLTEKGQAAYQTWRASPVRRPHQIRQEFMVKLYFALREGREEARFLIERQSDACREWLVQLQRDEQVAAEDPSFSVEVVKYRTGQVLAILDWLEKLAVNLENR